MLIWQIAELHQMVLAPKELSFNMKQKLWALAFVLALLRSWIFFHGGTNGDGRLETQGQLFTKINHLPHHSFSCVRPQNLSSQSHGTA